MSLSVERLRTALFEAALASYTTQAEGLPALTDAQKEPMRLFWSAVADAIMVEFTNAVVSTNVGTTVQVASVSLVTPGAGVSGPGVGTGTGTGTGRLT